MRKRSRKNRRFGLLRSSLYLCIAIAKLTIKFFKFAVGQLLTEIFVGSIILGFAYLFVSWGISSSLSFYLACGTVLTILILLAIAFIFASSSKHQQSKRVKIKLAAWISKTFVDKTSVEWTEYQDWLHDIFLARRQLLDGKCPKWKVAVITYWRLSAFLIIVSLSKIKSLAVSVMKLR